MEAKPWLATGHARTANARIKSREAWAAITVTLNSDGSGCVKTWEQWCKYWKDKKGATKKKASVISAVRRRTGGGVEEVAELSDIEKRIIFIMGGEQFATGDRHLEINPFQELPHPVNDSAESIQSQSILQDCQYATLQGASNIVQEYELHWPESAVAVVGEGSVRDTIVSPTPGPSIQTVAADVHPAPRPSPATDETISFSDGGREVLATEPENVHVEPSPARRRQEVTRHRPLQLQASPARSAARHQVSPARSAARHQVSAARHQVSPARSAARHQVSPARSAARHQVSAARHQVSPARSAARHQVSPARTTARRRLLRRSPPSQRRSEMATLTERFIAIEERRAQAEIITARSHELYAQGFQAMANSITQLAQALIPFAERIVNMDNN